VARRIALIVIALIAVLLGTVAVPLGLRTASQDRRDFRDETAATAAGVSSLAEEYLNDHVTEPGLARAIAGLERHGDQVAVYDAAGRWRAGTRELPRVSPSLIATSLAGESTSDYPSADRLLVVRPVVDGGTVRPVGVVALSRSTEIVDHEVAELWAWIALVSIIGLLAAALIATMLARWVGRPLGALEGAAQRLGDGRLGTRAPVEAGPREVRRLASNFNQMAARLETLVDGHQAMMADVSHQLRTPLAALRLRLDVLAQEMPAQVADELGGAQEEVARLSRMVDGLLAVARAEHITAPAILVPVAAVIKDREAAWRPSAEEKSVKLTSWASEPLTARIPEGHLEQMLDNLLANALEAVPPGGHIQVSAVAADKHVRIVVADDGPGMSEQQRRTAFRRYVTTTPGGTGLGLSIVHRLATSSGGGAELTQTPGGGLTVTIDVPAAPRLRAGRRPGLSSQPGRDL
jgi:signal transduction histidine kinase